MSALLYSLHHIIRPPLLLFSSVGNLHHERMIILRYFQFLSLCFYIHRSRFFNPTNPRIQDMQQSVPAPQSVVAVIVYSRTGLPAKRHLPKLLDTFMTQTIKTRLV